MLTVTTTHVKQGWHRRENIPASDEVTVVEHYVRHGNTLSHTSVTEDPIYLAEPLIKSEDYNLNPNPNSYTPYWPCEYTDEGEHERGKVPSYFWGENPYVAQYAAEHNLPQDVTLGGAETMYPEYRDKVKGKPVAVYPPPNNAAPYPASGGATAAPAAAPARGGSSAPATPPAGGRGRGGQ